MKRNLLLLTATLLICNYCFAAESSTIFSEFAKFFAKPKAALAYLASLVTSDPKARIFYFENLPQEIQKEVLSHLTRAYDVKNILLANKHLKDLITNMKNKREFKPAILWGLKAFQERELVYSGEPKQSIAVSADKEIAITSSKAHNDHAASIWDLKRGRIIKTLSGHTASINSVTLSPDKKIALTGSGDETAKVWDVETGQVIQTLSGHGLERVYSVALSPDKEIALTGSSDGTARVWNVTTGKIIHLLSGHDVVITCVAVSADKQIALTSSLDGTVRIWNLVTGDRIRILSRSSWPSTSIALSSDKKIALIGSMTDEPARVWNIYTGDIIQTFHGHTMGVHGVALSADTSVAITGSRDKTVKIWDMATGKLIQTLANSREVSAVALSPDACMIIAYLKHGNIKIWEIEKRENQ